MSLRNDIMLLYNAIASKNGQLKYKLVGLVVIEKGGERFQKLSQNQEV